MDMLPLHLVLHANAFLRGHREPPPKLSEIWRGDILRFVADGDHPVATDLQDWFEYLRDGGAVGLRFHPESGAAWRNVWMLNGVSNVIEERRPGRPSRFWSIHRDWEAASASSAGQGPQRSEGTAGAFFLDLAFGEILVDPRPPNNWLLRRSEDFLWLPLMPLRILAALARRLRSGQSFPTARTMAAGSRSVVTVSAYAEDEPSPEDPRTIDILEEQLREALAEAIAYGRANGVNLVERLEEARDVLDGGANGQGHAISPASLLDAHAERLLDAALTTHVFGGMGWWNDFRGETEESHKRFEAVTANLYHAHVDAIAYVCNR